MNDTLSVKIILPSKVALEAQASLVIIPGSKGVFGVLPGHAKLASTMDQGIVTLLLGDKETKYFVYGGVVRVTHIDVNIISEFAVNLATETTSFVNDKIITLQNDLSDVASDSIDAAIISDNIKKYQSLLKFI